MNQKVILHVEDELSHAVLVKRFLEHYQHDVYYTHVIDGEIALKYLRHENEYEDRLKYPMPNLILLDIRMPKISGFEVLKFIKSNELLRPIPVVMFSTSLSPENIAESYHSFANGYITKNVNLDEFYQTLESLLNYWLYCNVTPEF